MSNLLDFFLRGGWLWTSVYYSVLVAVLGTTANLFLLFISLRPGARIELNPLKINKTTVRITAISIYEEIIFRGILFNGLKFLWGIWGVSLEILLFTIIHIKRGWINILFALFIGLFFSLIMLKTSNIVGPIIGHILFNIVNHMVIRYKHPK